MVRLDIPGILRLEWLACRHRIEQPPAVFADHDGPSSAKGIGEVALVYPGGFDDLLLAGFAHGE